MSGAQASIRVNVDLANPGQFFACCGLFELADRLWPGVEGWFEQRTFCLSAGSLGEVIGALTSVSLMQVEPDNDTSSAIDVGDPFRPIRLNWWQDEFSGGAALKVWAGSMRSVRIAQAMQLAMKDARFLCPGLFDVGVVTVDSNEPLKKVEPYYFDARRAPNAHSRDVGFAPNDLRMTTTAYPAVEILCLVGLQRCLPKPTSKTRVFDYHAWETLIPIPLAPVAVLGLLGGPRQSRYRFENGFRTGQRKHKAFRSAVVISGDRR